MRTKERRSSRYAECNWRYSCMSGVCYVLSVYLIMLVIQRAVFALFFFCLSVPALGLCPWLLINELTPDVDFFD